MSKGRLWLAGVPVICALAVVRCGPKPWEKQEPTQQVRAQGAAEEMAGFPTKATDRSKRPNATHSPERLKHFFLQPVATRNLPLAAALEKLKTAYEEACVETGETALALEFQMPAGKTKPLKIDLGVNSLEASVHRLAMFSGMKVKREGAMYVFEAPTEAGEPRKKIVKVPNSLLHQLSMACHVITPDGSRDYANDLRVVGLDLDPATRVNYVPKYKNDGAALIGFPREEAPELSIEGTSAADELAVSASLAAMQEPILVPEHKFRTKVIELPASSNWTLPDLSQATAPEVQAMVSELTEQHGAELIQVQSPLAQEGETTKVDAIDPEWTDSPLGGAAGGSEKFASLSRELIVPVDGTDDQFEHHKLGMEMNITSRVLGFGHRTTFSFTDTIMPADWIPGQPPTEKRVDLKDTVWTKNGYSFLRMQERPDGSRTLVVVTGAVEMVPFRGFRMGL